LGDKGAEGRRISRRDLLRVAGATGAGLTLGAGGYAALRSGSDSREAGDEIASLPDLQTVAFHGPHQAGIATPQQEHLHFASVDVVSEDVSEVRDLMRAWSEAGARMSAGRPAGEENESSFLPPDDTGEAFGLSPARLTLTVGFGPTLFEKEGEDRFGGVMRGSGTARNRLGWRAAPTSWREGYGC
jgi:deferrochelatase/peroxidase EfeB